MTADIRTYRPEDHGHHPIGASDMPVILGLSQYRDATQWKTWGELAGLLPYREGKDTRAQSRGKMAEALIGVHYAQETGSVVVPAAHVVSAEFPWMSATPDFDVTDQQAGAIWMEAKSSRDRPWDEPRPDYLVQCHWQRMVWPRPRVDLHAWFVINDDFRTYPVHADLRLEAKLRAKGWEWYERHVIRGTPPPVDDRQSTGRIMARIYQQVTDEPVKARDTDRERLRQLSAIEEEIARLESAKTQIQNELRAVIGPKRRLVDAEGKPLASWSIEKKGRIRWGDMVRENPELADRYRARDAPRRLTITKRGKNQ